MNDLTSTKTCIAHVSYYKIGTKYMPIIGRLRYSCKFYYRSTKRMVKLLPQYPSKSVGAPSIIMMQPQHTTEYQIIFPSGKVSNRDALYSRFTTGVPREW